MFWGRHPFSSWWLIAIWGFEDMMLIIQLFHFQYRLILKLPLKLWPIPSRIWKIKSLWHHASRLMAKWLSFLCHEDISATTVTCVKRWRLRTPCESIAWLLKFKDFLPTPDVRWVLHPVIKAHQTRILGFFNEDGSAAHDGKLLMW